MGNAETRLTNHMRDDAKKIYGDRLVLVKYHGNEYSRAGVSDLLGCLDGAFFACEVKAPESYGGNVERALDQGPTVKQVAFIGHVQTAMGYAWVAATREQFLEGLAALDAMNREWCVMCQHAVPYCEEAPELGPCTIHPPTKPTVL